MSETANPSGQIHTVSGIHRLALTVASKVVRRWQDTLQYRYEYDFPVEDDLTEKGSILLLWHNRLFPGIGAVRQSFLADRPLHGLVSASRDGAQLTHFLEAQGIHPIRGSSSRRGAKAARELLKVLSAGGTVAVTVDGPRGPCYEAQPGASLLMQTGAPVYFVGIECESCRTLDSWDRFIIPAPFSRVNITLNRYVHPNLAGGKLARKAVQDLIQDKLRGLTHDIHREDF